MTTTTATTTADFLKEIKAAKHSYTTDNGLASKTWTSQLLKQNY